MVNNEDVCLGGWDNIELQQDNVIAKLTIIHCIPRNDYRPHVLWHDCWCHPTYIEHDICMHNSMDGREAYEKGRKLQ